MDKNNNSIRVRIAPSPTGYLHIGTARTALFNYLFARANHGSFLLRIEDTDLERSRDIMTESIKSGLNWLNLGWDEDVVYQSDHFDNYRERAFELLKRGKAYWCYCTPKEIEERKKKALNSHKRWMYDRRCYNLKEKERKDFEREGRPKALRFRIPPGVTEYKDLIHGGIKRDNSEIEDFVILKSDGSPTYNMAVVVDDHRMEITHVMRGDDHIPNTPKQILLYKAFGWKPPEFAHFPLILGKDRSKLSKRKNAVAISEYRDKGFLPEAMVNYLAFLGWSPKTKEEIFSLSELVERFTLKSINQKPAIFDLERLEWVNRKWMNRLKEEEIAKRLQHYLKEKGIDVQNREYIIKIVRAMGNRVKKFQDFIQLGYYFFSDDFSLDEKGASEHFYPGLSRRMRQLVDRLEELEPFNREGIEEVLRGLSQELGCRSAELIHPVRLGISGMTFGPGIFILMEVLGKKRVINRLQSLIEYLKGEEK
ncbi:MAG: glutamate--tRNA ligase [candidate division WOR-3 bacterium]|nr:glutamate--tRNA ligase [candidate division WOR-3 bacterium]